MTDPSRRQTWLFLLVFAILTAIFVRPGIAGIDGKGNYVYLLSALQGGDLDFADDYALIDAWESKPYRMSDAPRSETTGLVANRYGPGSAILWAPFVVPVHLTLEWVAPDLATGLTHPYRWGVAVGSVAWAGLAFLLLFRRLARANGAFVAGWVIGTVTFASSLFFYVWLHPSMSHAVSFFAATMAVLAIEQGFRLRRRSSILAAGAWAGLLVSIRVQDASWAVALGLGLLLFWSSSRGSDERMRDDGKDGEAGDLGGTVKLRWSAAAWYSLGACITFLPQWWVWKVLYGSWWSGPLPYLGREGGAWQPIPEHLLQTLLSERGGVFAWHPLLLLGLVGLFCWVHAARERALPATLLFGFALQLYVVSGWSMWWAGHSFGNRFFISSYPALILGLGWLIGRWKHVKRSTFLIAATLLVIWNMGLVIQYGSKMIPRGDEVGWGVVIVNQFTAVPAWIAARLSEFLLG